MSPKEIEFREFLNSNSDLANVKTSKLYPDLSVIKYSKKTFVKNLWNEQLEHCRGLVVDSDLNVVSRPFTKIFNYGLERRAPCLDDSEPVVAQRKVNGFMAAITVHNSQLLLSTTGSLDSDFVGYIKESIDYDRYLKVLSNVSDYTFMFECVHPKDPHIIKEEPGMYLLGFRAKSWVWPRIHYDQLTISDLANMLGCRYPEYVHCSLGELKESVKTVEHEGYVFYNSDGISAKLKSPYYLINKFLARKPKPEDILKETIWHRVDEEFYPLINYLRENFPTYATASEQSRLELIQNYLRENHATAV